MKISEVAKCTGLSISTIRYYEKSGLCPLLRRSADGDREFTQTDVDWLTLLSSLRATGMPMSEMRSFATLYASGDITIPDRKAALLTHRKNLEDRQTELNHCRALLELKLRKYDDILKDQK